MIKLTTHMEWQAAERKIAQAWIEATISGPDWMAQDRDPALTQSFKRIAAFGGRVLKVVHCADGADILVVTAHFDRGDRQAMMRTSYDPQADAFYARFAREGIEIAETREVAPGVTIDMDAKGNLVGVEVLSVSLRGAGTYGALDAERAAE